MYISNVYRYEASYSEDARKFFAEEIDFSATFDCVSHSGLLYILRDVCVGGAVFDVISGFLSGRVQRVVVDGIRSENVKVVSLVPQGNVLGPLLFFAVH